MKKFVALVAGAVLVAACQDDTRITGPAALDQPVPTNGLAGVAECVDPPSGLVSWWPGDGDATDIIGGNDGTLKSTAGFADGIAGQAFSFDGVGYILVPDDPSLDLTGSLTMEFWFKYGAVPGRLQGFVAKRAALDDTPPTNYGASFSGPLGFLLYYADNVTTESGGDFPTSSFNVAQALPAPMPAAGVFHHFAGTYQQAAETHVELKIYIDGNLARSAVIPGNLANTVNDHPLTIGASLEVAGFGPVEPFQGIIDEVSIYNRALTGDPETGGGEIGAIYNAGSAGKCHVGDTPEIPEIVDFSEFEIEQAEYESDSEDGDEFEVEGMFVLGTGSDGIDVLNEDVIVTLHRYSQTIPAGSFFRDDDDEGFEFDDGVLQVEIRDDGEFEVKGEGLDLSGIDLTNPVAFSLQIGNDIGQTMIPFDDEGEYERDDDDDDEDDDDDDGR